MADLEKVIKAIETHIDDSIGCDDCTYGNDGRCIARVMKDALELLKEKVVKPVLIREGKSKMYNDYRCPRCDQEIVYEQNYCCECGSTIDWATD